MGNVHHSAGAQVVEATGNGILWHAEDGGGGLSVGCLLGIVELWLLLLVCFVVYNVKLSLVVLVNQVHGAIDDVIF